jgi:murein L,D-transpeptidase YafK
MTHRQSTDTFTRPDYFRQLLLCLCCTCLFTPALSTSVLADTGASVWSDATGFANPSQPLRASRILVDKSDRTLTVFSAGKILRQYPVSLGLNPKGHKQQEGDKRTPEGIYLIDFKNPDSAFYRSLRVSYPNERDKRAAEERGVEPGGLIMIHGTPNGRLIRTSSSYGYDWTDGCIAVSNTAMDELWRLVEPGTLIEIRP